MENFNLSELEYSNISEINKGDIVKGKIIKISNNTIFIDFGYKMEGKIELSEFQTPPNINDEIEALVIDKNDNSGDLSLSYSQAKFMKAWEIILEIYEDTPYISGTIVEESNNGYVVDIGLPAFLPFSHIKRVNDFEELRNKQLMFKIIDIKEKNKQIIVSRRLYLAEANEKSKKEIFETIEEGKILEGHVKNIIPTGVFVDIGGLDAYIPKTELSWGRNTDPKDVVTINQKIKAIVISFDKTKERITLSLKNMQSNPWNSLDEKFQEGMIAKGKVVKIINSGVFVELEPGIEGYIAKENLTWAKHIKSPDEIIKVNDLVEFKILNLDKINKKISLGLKQILENPWDEISKKYFVGQKVTCKVKYIVKNGCYVEIDDNVEGFIDLHNVSWTKNFQSGFSAFKKGDNISAAIVDINSNSHLIQLSLKQLSVNPWEIINGYINTKTPVEITIEKITPRGTYVKINEEINGLIPVRHYILNDPKDPNPSFKVGEKITSLIIDVDNRNKLAICSPREYRNSMAEQEMQQYLKKDPSEKIKLGDFFNLKKSK